MTLWVCSQDKTDLICTKRVYVVNSQIRTNVNETIGFAILGEYATKERALEVLDEIHNHLEKMYWFNPQVEEDKRLKSLLKSYVYNMPEE